MRPPRRTLLITLAAAVALAVAAVAWADLRSVKDANDAPGRMDIREASVGHSSDGRLRHVVRTIGRWQPSDLVSEQGPPGGVCIHIWTRRRPSAGPADYLACANANQAGDELEGRLTRVSRKVARSGSTKTIPVSRADARSVVLRFGQSQIGRPSRYFWRAETVYYADSCPDSTGCLDAAPDVQRTSSHRLRKPRRTAGTG